MKNKPKPKPELPEPEKKELQLIPQLEPTNLEPVALLSPDLFRYDSIVRLVRELFDRQKLLMLSRLSPDMGALVTRFKVITKLRDIRVYNDLAELLMERSIGEKGKAREELRDLVQAASKGNKKDKNSFNSRWGRGAKNDNFNQNSSDEQ